MKLTEQAKAAIDRKAILSLALSLGFTEVWITKLVEMNKENGPLTTAKSVQVLKQETGLTDSEILEEETEPVKNRA